MTIAAMPYPARSSREVPAPRVRSFHSIAALMQVFLLGVSLVMGVGCAGPMVSTAVLKDRSPNGGTVRITSPSYPPSAEVQGKAKELVGQVCAGRNWKFVELSIDSEQNRIPKDDTNSDWVWWAGYGVPAHKAAPLKPNQVTDIRFDCLGN